MNVRNPTIHLRCAVVALIALASCAFAQSDAQFARANQDYAQGKFKEAIDGYNSVVHSGNWNASLFYNLGNAYFRTGDFGRAILNYERALALEPNHPETQANLRIARDEARALELPPGWPERFLRFANVNQYAIAAAVAFWIGAFCIAAAAFWQRRRRRLVVFSLLLWSIFVLLGYMLAAIENGPKGRSFAIVTGSDVQARLATADNAGSVLALPPGSEITIVRQRGDWIYAALPNSLSGWVPAKSVEAVRL
jgi:tetratricopeptide (TPR) repeat protein